MSNWDEARGEIDRLRRLVRIADRQTPSAFRGIYDEPAMVATLNRALAPLDTVPVASAVQPLEPPTRERRPFAPWRHVTCPVCKARVQVGGNGSKDDFRKAKAKHRRESPECAKTTIKTVW